MAFEHFPVPIIVAKHEQDNTHDYPHKGTQICSISDDYVILKTIKNPIIPSWIFTVDDGKHKIRISKIPKLFAIVNFCFLKTNKACYKLRNTNSSPLCCEVPKYIVTPLYKPITSLSFSSNMLVILTQKIAFEIHFTSYKMYPASKQLYSCLQCNNLHHSYASTNSGKYCFKCASKSDADFKMIVKCTIYTMNTCHFSQFKKRALVKKDSGIFFETGEKIITHGSLRHYNVKKDDKFSAFSMII